MPVETHRVLIDTEGNSQVLDLTERLRASLESGTLRDGIVTICVVASTVAIWKVNCTIADDTKATIKIEDSFLGSLHQLLDGFKELKMSRARNLDLFENYLQLGKRVLWSILYII